MYKHIHVICSAYYNIAFNCRVSMMGWVGLSCVSESGATSNSASTLHAAAAAMTSVNDDDTAETALLESRHDRRCHDVT